MENIEYKYNRTLVRLVVAMAWVFLITTLVFILACLIPANVSYQIPDSMIFSTTLIIAVPCSICAIFIFFRSNRMSKIENKTILTLKEDGFEYFDPNHNLYRSVDWEDVTRIKIGTFWIASGGHGIRVTALEINVKNANKYIERYENEEKDKTTKAIEKWIKLPMVPFKPIIINPRKINLFLFRKKEQQEILNMSKKYLSAWRKKSKTQSIA